MAEELCNICSGYQALPSKRTDIWCPRCNLEMYLVDEGIVQDARYQTDHSIRALQEELNSLWICRKIKREDADALVQQAHELRRLVRASPELGDQLTQKHETYLRDFKAQKKYRGLTDRKS
jgi:hypothetical protein